MKIESLRLKNFRAFRDTEIRDIPRFCVLVGANGSGKSTFFSIFAFLKEAMQTNVTVAAAKLGGSRGLLEIRSRQSSGPIEIELKFRAEIGQGRERLITYELAIDEEKGRAVVVREILKYRRHERSGQPWHFLDFARGEGDAVTNELESVETESDLKREPQKLKSSDILAIKGLAQFEKFPAVKALGDLIEGWHISDFHINRARSEQESGYAEHLSREGDNLSLVVEFLHKQHPEIFQKILRKLEHRIPGLSKVETKVTDEGKILLKFQDGAFEDPFLARYVSDGTIKMLAYLVLLHDPSPHPLLCIEEPENQLYPKFLMELAEEFQDYARRGGQVFVSTHSPDFLNACEPKEVFWLTKAKGGSSIKAASKDEQIMRFVAEGDKLGWLWQQGFFTGADPQ